MHRETSLNRENGTGALGRGGLEGAAVRSGRGASAPRPLAQWGGHARWWSVLLCVACAAGERAPELDLPPRPGDAPGGTELLRDLSNLDLEPREERLYAEVSRGNVPTWLRQLVRVEMNGEVDGRVHRVTFWTAPDYLAVGSDTDFVLVPLSPRTARRVADRVGGSLPTPGMVDAVWSSARVRLAPIRIPPDEFLATVQYFDRHDRLVRAQRGLRGVPPGVFVAGHKLDVVLPSTHPGNTPAAAIYGWHRPDGHPIQSLTTDLPDDWVNYNLGIRLVDRSILVDGVRRDLLDVLRDPGLAPLLSSATAQWVLAFRGPLSRQQMVQQWMR
jgi:hypothetical protein